MADKIILQVVENGVARSLTPDDFGGEILSAIQAAGLKIFTPNGEPLEVTGAIVAAALTDGSQRIGGTVAVKSVDPAKVLTPRVYDANGNLTTEVETLQDGTVRTWTYTYDADDNMLTDTYVDA